ncbi:MAG: MFS transporter [Chloroflexi bacterium]|nr:MFS transporter [Chloroflexota bacterium]
MKTLSLIRLLALSSFSFALTLTTNTLEPALFGHQVLALAPDRPNTVLGFATFAGSIIAMILPPLVGALSDRTHSRWGSRIPFFIIGTAGLVFTLFLIGTAPSLAVFVLGVLFYRFTENIIYSPWQALYPDHVPQHQRGKAAGIKGMADILGLIIGRQAAGQLVGHSQELGPIALVVAVAIPAAALLISLIATIVATRQEAQSFSKQVDQQVKNKSIKNYFKIDYKKYPAFIWWFANRFFFWCAFTIVGTFVLFFVIDVIGVEEAQAQVYLGNLAIILGGAILIISLPAGVIADRIGRKPLLIFAGLLAAGGTYILLISRDVIILSLGGGLIGLAAGVFISANFALITDIVPKKEAARYLGVASIATASGSALARLLGGAIVDPLNRYYDSNTAGYLSLYAIAVLFYILSTVAAIRLPAPKLEKSIEIDR